MRIWKALLKWLGHRWPEPTKPVVSIPPATSPTDTPTIRPIDQRRRRRKQQEKRRLTPIVPAHRLNVPGRQLTPAHEMVLVILRWPHRRHWIMSIHRSLEYRGQYLTVSQTQRLLDDLVESGRIQRIHRLTRSGKLWINYSLPGAQNRQEVQSVTRHHPQQQRR